MQSGNVVQKQVNYIRLVATRFACRVGRNQHLLHPPKGGCWGKRLLGETVEAGTSEAAGLQGLHKGRLVHHRAARRR
jgi:hypothetical protein